MISHNNIRMKKANSLLASKDFKQNKQNCSVNIQQPSLANKIGKIRNSIGITNADQKKATENLIAPSKSSSEKNLGDINKQLKKQYSLQLKEDYSQEILSHLLQRDISMQQVLKNHEITGQLRAKMVDWMIQVMSSYKMSQDSFFRSVRYMDIFFMKTQKKLQVSDLHLVGVVSMFTASKYQEIFPFKLNAIYDKICRKKFSKRQILDMEELLMLALDFQLQQVTPFDIILHIQHDINIQMQTKVHQYLRKVCIYLAKMAMHCPQVAWVSNNVLGASVLFIALKTVQQVNENLKADQHIEKIAHLANIKVSDMLECSQQLLGLAKNFQKQYPSLLNLKKFNNAQYFQQ